jgi:hypothetical protein
MIRAIGQIVDLLVVSFLDTAIANDERRAAPMLAQIT